MILFEKDSPKDLLLRGFSREEILQKTGVDVGYHGAFLKSECLNIDRLEYKAEYVIRNFEKSYVLQVLDAYADGADKQQILSMLGLSGVNITPLHQLFFKVGCNEDFKVADKKNKSHHMKHGFSAKFGTENPFSMKAFQEKAVQTRIEKYGGAYTLSHGSSLREGAVQTFSERIQDRHSSSGSKKKRKHLCCRESSCIMNISAKDELYDMLLSIFGENDVIRQYQDERYLYSCDFYIKSRDLFIELNSMWMHNTHWHTDGLTDRMTSSDWKTFYLDAYETWTSRDVAKRAEARHSKLNYVVFWDAGLDDARLWIAMGCPDGQDWEREYSWLPHQHLRLSDKIPDLKPGWRNVVAAVRHANWRSFYHREIAMWQENVPTRKGRLIGALYANRYKYLGKLPDELTNLEILRGMSIAGFVKGYSVFNNTAMDMVLQQYRPKYVYDPCAGWGERMLTCALYDIGYLGVDINPHAIAGHDKLRKAYHLIGQATVKDDASVYDMSTSGHDAVITCPPYWKKEIYSEFGAENYSREEFLDWWRAVIKHSVSDTVRLFAYQISGDLGTDMNAELFQYGFRLIDMIDTKQDHISHFQRKHGTVKATEYMMIFVR